MQVSKTKPKAGTIGYWLTDKKIQKINMKELKKACKDKGYDLVKLDFTKPLEDQGPFCVIFQKLTDVIVKANTGDKKSQDIISEFERYALAHPEVPIVDPLDRVRRILDRYQWYLAINCNPRLTAAKVFTPTSVELTSSDPIVNLSVLREAGVGFPFVCKPLVSHGSTAHQMSLIFNEAGVSDCKPPSVAQAFINHNANLHKIYCIGDEYVVVVRPSLKNFYSFSDKETIFFTSGDVNKADSTSSLTELDSDDPAGNMKPVGLDPERVKVILETLREEIGISLLGIDIVIENNTDRYAIVDLNVYPGYDGYPNFFDSLINHLIELVEKRTVHQKGDPNSSVDESSETISPTAEKFPGLTRSDQDDSGFDTSDSSDEKNRQLNDCCKMR